MKDELHAYVARQAIFDRRLNVVGYELQYRDGDDGRAQSGELTRTPASTMLDAFVELGLDNLVGNLPAYVTISADFVLGSYRIPLPPDRAVLEVHEDAPVTPELVGRLKDLRTRGYKIALEDFVLTDETRPLLSVASIVKVSVLDMSQDDIAAQYAALKPSGAILLAEKISTHDELVFVRNLGFYYFQGHFLETPVMTRTPPLRNNRARLLRLLASLYDPELDPRSLEELIASEAGLAVRLVQLAGSAALTRGSPVGSPAQALVRLGVPRVAALIVLIVASSLDKPLELTRQVMIRARMCELLARQAGVPPDEMFTAGLLSLLDAIVDRPLPEILAQLPVSPRVREAVEGGGSQPAQIVEIVRHQNRGDLRSLSAAGLSAQAVFMAWYEAVRWSDDIIGRL